MRDGTALLLLAAVWILGALIVNPAGEFPLNDDWSYAKSVQSLVETGKLTLCEWTAVPLIAQALWGAVFCLPFGFSFTALRISTLLLGLAGIFGMYALLRARNIPGKIALVSSLTLAVCPIYVILSHSFMTDVPFFAFLAFAAFFFVRALYGKTQWDLAWAIVFTTCAILIRQLAICLPLAFLVVVLLLEREKKRTMPWAVVAVAVPLVALWFFERWLVSTQGVPEIYQGVGSRLSEAVIDHPLRLIRRAAEWMPALLIYLGLFTAPWWLTIWSGRLREVTAQRKARQAVGFLGLSLLATLLVRLTLGPMPLARNLVNSFGLGPATLRDVHLLHLPNLPVLPEWLWNVALFAGCFGAIFILRELWSVLKLLLGHWRERRWEAGQSVTLFLLLAAVIYTAPIFIAGFFDRYLVPLICLVPAVLTPTQAFAVPRSRYRISVAVTVMFFAISTLGVRDYLAWNRVRWQALNELTQQHGISSRQIDGGFEFNGWYNYDPAKRVDHATVWWWVEDDTYLLSFGPVPGYRKLREYPYTRWLPPSRGVILVSEKLGAGE